MQIHESRERKGNVNRDAGEDVYVALTHQHTLAAIQAHHGKSSRSFGW